jgi:hypothetical protein
MLDAQATPDVAEGIGSLGRSDPGATSAALLVGALADVFALGY